MNNNKKKNQINLKMKADKLLKTHFLPHVMQISVKISIAACYARLMYLEHKI